MVERANRRLSPRPNVSSPSGPEEVEAAKAAESLGSPIMRSIGGASGSVLPAPSLRADNTQEGNLPASEREFFEPRFGHDFSNVRIHSDDKADEMAQAVDALAFTSGRDIFFRHGTYMPGSSSGRRILAHELAHVVQTEGRSGNPERDGEGTSASSGSDSTIYRLPSPPRMATRQKGLSPVGPIYQNNYDGSKATTISSSWGLTSFQRRWTLYDSRDRLLDEQFYTWPDPTYEIEAPFITAGEAGGEERPWSIWIEVTKTMNPLGSSNPEYFPYDYVTFPVFATRLENHGRSSGFGTAVPKGLTPGDPANVNVEPEVAIEIIKNSVEGKLPWRPELGKKGGSAFFVTEGQPYVGIDGAKNIRIEVELAHRNGIEIFDEARLRAIHVQEVDAIRLDEEAKFRRQNGIGESEPLTNKQLKTLERRVARVAESRMWTRVGDIVRQSASRAGEVILQEGSVFSKSSSGKFAVVADAAMIRLKGGVDAVLAVLKSNGVSVEPVLEQAAGALANKMKWAGRVRGVFRYGGKLLLVVAVAHDIYRIYEAESKLKVVLTTVGGWAGASVAGAAFGAWFTPADTAGPWAWAAHGVGTLVAGGVGYWVGSESVRYIYELTPLNEDEESIQRIEANP